MEAYLVEADRAAALARPGCTVVAVTSGGVGWSREFERTVRGVHGVSGVAWLSRLPALLAEVRACWGLTAAGRSAVSYNYVEPVVRADGTPAVLKLGVPATTSS